MKMLISTPIIRPVQNAMNRVKGKKTITSFAFIFFALLLILFPGCNTPKTSASIPPIQTNSTPSNEGSIFSSAVPSIIITETNQAEVLLLFAGYGYEYGDVVLLDVTATPKAGDIVLYDWTLNKSNFQGFGPQYQLAKVIALPGESVIFERSSYEANGFDVNLQVHNTPVTTDVAWGSAIYADVSGLTLQVPNGEFLSDRWIGREGRPEDFGKENYVSYNRFTIKKEAVSGIVLKKIEHKDIPQITW
jgi:hypothetical protein